MLRCPFCFGSKVRRSRLRLSDLLPLLLLRRPYRCYSCSRRFVGFWWAPLADRFKTSKKGSNAGQ